LSYGIFENNVINLLFAIYMRFTAYLPSVAESNNIFCYGRYRGLNTYKKIISNNLYFLKKNSKKFNRFQISSSKIISNLDKSLSMEYSLDNYHRSNQDTCLVHKPAVFEGQWVQSGDLLADCSSSIGGELALGQNILIAYMPWEGYNFEDAILISERLVYDDLYTSIHIERYEVEIRETKLGSEEITRDIPEVSENALKHLHSSGIAKLGSWVQEGDILVGKVTPINKKNQSNYQKLLYTILEKPVLPVRNSSLLAPKGIKAKVIGIQIFKNNKNSVVLKKKKPLGQKIFKTLGNKKNVSHNISFFNSNESNRLNNANLILNNAYRNKVRCFSFNSSKSKMKNIDYQNSFLNCQNQNTLTNNLMIGNKIIKPKMTQLDFSYLKKMDSLVENNAIIVNANNKESIRLRLKKKFYKKLTNSRVNTKITKIQGNQKQLLKGVSSIQIYLAEKRRVQVGDKMAGRHGNKGIISQILPLEDMPFLPDGTPLDMVLNPLGVPSRMNVGQIYECLLGLAGKHLGENFKIFPFDETYGAEASRSFVYSKLYNARVKTGKNWLFNPNSPGKMRLYDGRTGSSFHQAVTVGYAYMLRLVHMVDDKIHARSTGPYSLVTQQPLRGRSKQGGQRLGEMEVWALEGYGAAFTLLEMLTIKSDDMTGRMTLWSNLILNNEISIGTPESFKVLICELQALCLDIGLFRANSSNSNIA
jgi:DNA-directed RNA polymerase subunit beta